MSVTGGVAATPDDDEIPMGVTAAAAPVPGSTEDFEFRSVSAGLPTTLLLTLSLLSSDTIAAATARLFPRSPLPPLPREEPVVDLP